MIVINAKRQKSLVEGMFMYTLYRLDIVGIISVKFHILVYITKLLFLNWFLNYAGCRFSFQN